MVNLFGPADGPCCVCGMEIVDRHYAECSVCIRMFHMRMTETDLDKKDCGIVELDEENWVMLFTCMTCAREVLAAQEERV